jgi:hypothetical protein
VSASWTADGDAIKITSGGVVTALRIGFATVRATANDRAGSGAFLVSVVPNLAGTWRGTITVAYCERVRGEGADPCGQRSGIVQPLVLAISQVMSSSDQVDLIIAAEAFTPPAKGTIPGAVDSSGAIFIQGVLVRSADQFDVRPTIRAQLTGTRIEPFEQVEVMVTMHYAGIQQSLREVWQLSALVRQ